MRTHPLAPITIVSLLLTASGADRAPGEALAPPGTVPTVHLLATAPCATSPSDDPEAKPSPPSADELAPLVHSNNSFGIALYSKLRSRRTNIALSPVSLSSVLVLAWSGAKGDTAEQMKRALQFKGTPEQAMALVGTMASRYRDPARVATIRIASRIFGDKAFAFEESYLAGAKASFEAPVERVDFRSDPEGSRSKINAWIAEETQQHIKELIPSPEITDTTQLVLANAVYFCGTWSTGFDASKTRPEVFRTALNPALSVPMMHSLGYRRFAATDGVRVLDLPYEGDEFSMTLVLPDRAADFEALEKRLTAGTFAKWISALKERRVDIALPTFEIDPASSDSLAKELQSLGVKLAFDPMAADLTGIANAPPDEPRLHFTSLFHKATVKLDESGTEATAASALGGGIFGSPPETEKPQQFHANRPFLFFLRDTRTNMILFMGRVGDPSAR